MAYEFKKLGDVEVVETPMDTANVLIEEDGVIKKVAKDEVGGVKVASAAEVGQTIVVKAVDENGKPTEWETTNFPEGVKSWNDLEDKPFYEEVTRTLIVEGVPSYGGTYWFSPVVNIEGGVEYTCVIDDIKCSGVAYHDDGWSVDLRNAEGNIIAYMYSGSLQLDDKYFDLTVSHKCELLDTEIKQIDPKFIPQSGGLVQRIEVVRDGQTYSSENTFEDVAALVDEGVFMYVVVKDANGTIKTSDGVFLYNSWEYPDDDRLYFYHARGNKYIYFSSTGSIVYGTTD